MSDAAELHTCHARDAQALLDDAVNLVGLLLDAVEHDGDTRAEQARTILGMAVECLLDRWAYGNDYIREN